jgi:hypothetical protein
MDPNEALRRFLLACMPAVEDRQQAIEALADLVMWIDGHRGFLPDSLRVVADLESEGLLE